MVYTKVYMNVTACPHAIYADIFCDPIKPSPLLWLMGFLLDPKPRYDGTPAPSSQGPR